MVDHSKDKLAGARLLVQIGKQSVKGRLDLEQAFSQNLGSKNFFHQILDGSSPPITSEDNSVTACLLSESPSGTGESDVLVFEAALRRWGDQVDGGALALLATIFHKAKHAHDHRLFFHYWLSENMRSWLGPRGFDLPTCVEELKTLRQRIQNMLTMGINLRGRSSAEFLAAQFEVMNGTGGHQFGAGYVLDSIVAASSFAGAGLLETVDVLSMAPHNRADVCDCFGLLAGTFYGRSRLVELGTFGEQLTEFFRIEVKEEGDQR